MFPTGSNKQVYVWQIMRVKMAIYNGIINILGRNYIIFNFETNFLNRMFYFFTRSITQGQGKDHTIVLRCLYDHLL